MNNHPNTDDLADVPPGDGNLEYDAAMHAVPVPQTLETVIAPAVTSPAATAPSVAPPPEAETHDVAVPESVETIVSSRALKPLPAPTLPPEVATALGLNSPDAPAPASEPTALGALGASCETGSSAFWDDEDYFVTTVHQGTLEIRLRELSEETLYFVTSINSRIEEATEGRVSATLAAHLFDGLKRATAKEKEQAEAISPADVVLVKGLISAMRDKALCEGINNWVERNPQAKTRPCTDDNKLLLGRTTRDECLEKIFKVSTSQTKDTDFLARS